MKDYKKVVEIPVEKIKMSGKDIKLRYSSEAENEGTPYSPENDLQQLASDADIPFNVID